MSIQHTDELMSDNRTSQRQKTFKGGTISFDRAAGIDCIVRNLSATGARLQIESHMGIPEEFTLVIKPEFIRRSCQVAWRAGRNIGVRFV